MTGSVIIKYPFYIVVSGNPLNAIISGNVLRVEAREGKLIYGTGLLGTK
ncbi:MAG: hypothetical protein HY365_00330 [Candidatus Aenigmarchaeota archaeon]|nr:hypothetical protein [Candidatus Aenigmarchaeota archaeon]